MVEKGKERGGERLGKAAGGGSAGGTTAAAAGGRGEAGDAVPHHDGQKAVEAGRSCHVNDGVELGEVGIAVQVDDGGEGLKGRCLDLHQVLALHLQQLYQLLQQAGIQEPLRTNVRCR